MGETILSELHGNTSIVRLRVLALVTLALTFAACDEPPSGPATRTDRSPSACTDGAAHWCSRSILVARECARRRSTPGRPCRP
jgi:hypothetical protein